MSEALSITDEEWRAVGYTPTARKYPLSRAAVAVLCFMNRLKLNQVPRTWHYAPNEAVQLQMENLARSSVAVVAIDFAGELEHG